MFEIRLHNIKQIELNEVYDINEHKNNYETWEEIIADICEIFEISKKIEFSICGFNESSWKVDCMFDLATFMESLSKIIKRFNENKFNFTIDFYEQGVERELIFNESKKYIIIECISRTNWKPSPKIEYISKNNLVKMFVGVYLAFIKFANIFCKYLIENPILSDFLIDNNELLKLKQTYL